MASAPSRPTPIRVLIVDDTVVVRRLVSEVLGGFDDIEVVGTASHGRLALQQIPLTRPDVVTLDIEMPVMDGLRTLGEIRKQWPDLPVIMFSSLTERGATATLDALALGANDYVTKPSATRDRESALNAVRASLVPLVRLWGRPRRGGRLVDQPLAPRAAAPTTQDLAASRAARVPAAPVVMVPTETRPPLAVVIGVSTGGPQALTQVLPKLPRELKVPVVVVQHMPPVFTKMLAERLDAQCLVTVVEAENGMLLKPGHVYLAAGGHHLRLEQRGDGVVCVLDDSPPENSCRPSVDVTMRSAREVWGSRTLAVMLTGMGLDGLLGVRGLKEVGARVIAQDEATSVVWGMPGAVAKEGLADHVLPLGQIGAAVVATTDRARLVVGVGSR